MPCPPPGDLPNSETEPTSLRSPALEGGFFTTSATWHIDMYWLVQGYVRASPVAHTVKKSACNAGNPGSIPGSGTSPREGNRNPLQYSCLENSTESMGSQRVRHN